MKIVGYIVILPKGNVAGVVQMDIVAEKDGPLEMDVMDHLVVMLAIDVFVNRDLDCIKPKVEN